MERQKLWEMLRRKNVHNLMGEKWRGQKKSFDSINCLSSSLHVWHRPETWPKWIRNVHFSLKKTLPELSFLMSSDSNHQNTKNRKSCSTNSLNHLNLNFWIIFLIWNPSITLYYRWGRKYSLAVCTYGVIHKPRGQLRG